MRATRRRSEERNAQREEKEHAETDREILSARPCDCRLERAALMLYEQSPAPEVLFSPLAGATGEWLFTSETGDFIAACTVANRRTRRPSEEERLRAGTKK
jgi:hypothetical protein